MEIDNLYEPTIYLQKYIWIYERKWTNEIMLGSNWSGYYPKCTNGMMLPFLIVSSHVPLMNTFFWKGVFSTILARGVCSILYSWFFTTDSCFLVGAIALTRVASGNPFYVQIGQFSVLCSLLFPLMYESLMMILFLFLSSPLFLSTPPVFRFVE